MKHKLLAVLLLAVSGCCSAWAQLATNTSLVGNVIDSTGAAVAGATVTAVNQGTQEVYTDTTNAEGFYEVQFVKIGTYTVTVKHSGFETMVTKGVPVSTNQTARTDFTMKVGAVNEQVVVTADAPPISTEDAALNETISTKAVAELPTNGRNPLRLAITTPTVIPGLKSPAGNPGGGEGYIGAGTREIQNSVSLDGVSIMNNLITTTTFRPSIDAVQEVQVQTGTYPAQYGGYLGLQLNLITKPGTNNLHGAIFEFARNNALDARNFFAKSIAPFHQNQYGFALSGPVVLPKLYNGRNRTFFLINYERLKQTGATSATASVFTQRMRSGDLSELAGTFRDPFAAGTPAFAGNIIPASRLSPQAVKLLQYMPLANAGGVTANFLTNALLTNTTNQTIDRVDQNFGEKVRLFVRYALGNTDLNNGNASPYNGYTQPVRDRNFVIGYTQVFSPSVINDLRFGRQHTTIDSINYFDGTTFPVDATTQLGIPGFASTATNPGLPVVSITNYISIGGDNQASSNWYQTDTTWQGSDSFNITRGAHSMTAGVDIRKVITIRTANNAPRGQLTFSGQVTGNAVADFLLGLPQVVTTPGQLFPGGAAQWRDGFFFQDKWQVSSKLTINYGLRYELPTVPQSKTGFGTILNKELTKFIPEQVPGKIPFNDPDHNNFAPRFGFAYRITPRFVARGGFGIYYNPNQLNSYTLPTTNPPFSTIFTYNTDTSNPANILTLNNPTPAGQGSTASRVNAFTINPYLPNATMNQWSFSLEHGLWHNAGIDFQYLGSHSYHLDRSFQANTPAPGPGVINNRRPNPLFLNIRIIQNDEIANYEGLSVVFRQQYARGLTSLISYTWSKTLDVSTDSNGGGAPMDPFDWHRDYGRANWDIPHRFVASYTYELPFLRDSHQPFLKYAIAGWQLNGITIAQSGLPFNVTIPTDIANTGAGSQRPNLVATPTSNCGAGHLTGCIDPSAFAIPALYTYGNAGRNILRGPGLVQFDMSLFKNFAMTERAKFQFRAEAFNVFNHVAFANPNATFNVPTPATFGTITGTQNNARQLQLAAKIVF